MLGFKNQVIRNYGMKVYNMYFHELWLLLFPQFVDNILPRRWCCRRQGLNKLKKLIFKVQSFSCFIIDFILRSLFFTDIEIVILND